MPPLAAGIHQLKPASRNVDNLKRNLPRSLGASAPDHEAAVLPLDRCGNDHQQVCTRYCTTLSRTFGDIKPRTLPNLDHM